MNMDYVQNIVKLSESPITEFKSTTSQLGSACETVCAFLNAKGGTVLIGVKNNGQVIGQHVTDNTKQEIARELKKIEPPTHEHINVEYIPFDENKIVIMLHVMSGRHAPYTYDGRPYARIESSTSIMPQHLYEQLLVRRGQLNHSWEDQPAKNYEIESVDHDEIRRTIKAGVDKGRISVEVLDYDESHILDHFKLIDNGKLINAAVVLYTKDVKPNYPQCMIRLARFKGTNNIGDFIDNQRVYGNAFRIISAAIEFAQRYLPIASFFEEGKIERRDQPAVPPLALREALVNAISHRDYENRSASIALAIYDDRLELWNNGVLPPQLTIDDLRKKHGSYPRNEKIATVFYEIGWVEGWGTGTTRMIGYCRDNGTPEPKFEEYSGGFAVIFRFKEPMGGGKTRKTLELRALTIRQKKILEILVGEESLSVNLIFDRLDDIASLRTIKADLAILKKSGLIEQVGSGKLSSWRLKK